MLSSICSFLRNLAVVLAGCTQTPDSGLMEIHKTRLCRRPGARGTRDPRHAVSAKMVGRLFRPRVSRLGKAIEELGGGERRLSSLTRIKGRRDRDDARRIGGIDRQTPRVWSRGRYIWEEYREYFNAPRTWTCRSRTASSRARGRLKYRPPGCCRRAATRSVGPLWRRRARR
jgi:starvation-inducible outer membrane lipoprotein